MASRDTEQEDAIAALQRPSLTDRLDNWMSRALMALLIGGGGAGAVIGTNGATDEHATDEEVHALEAQVEELETRLNTQGGLIGENRADLKAHSPALDQVIITVLRTKAAAMAPRDQGMEYADRAQRQYNRLVVSGMARDAAMRETLYSMRH